jgi:hypothetical protein
MTMIGRDLPTEERRKLFFQLAHENREKGKTFRVYGGSLAKAEECDRNADYYLHLANDLQVEKF